MPQYNHKTEYEEIAELFCYGKCLPNRSNQVAKYPIYFDGSAFDERLPLTVRVVTITYYYSNIKFQIIEI